MAKSIKVHPKKRRGRPATGKDPLVSARLPQTLVNQIGEWSSTHGIGRSEAIRRLVELGLTVKTKLKQAPIERATRARELARKAIEKVSDPSASSEERTRRRRRLTRGPLEFRDERLDLPESKRDK